MGLRACLVGNGWTDDDDDDDDDDDGLTRRHQQAGRYVAVVAVCACLCLCASMRGGGEKITRAAGKVV